jgi:hypothetical protein
MTMLTRVTYVVIQNGGSMKRYTLELVITEGNDEGWEEILNDRKTGCDDVISMVANALYEAGLDPTIKLVKFEDK